MFADQFKIADTDLASRQAAAELRAQIVQHVLTGSKQRASIDFSNVLSISESYADELFGVLALRYGLEWLTNSVVIHQASPFVFRAISNAIRQRLSSQAASTPDIAVLTARKVLDQRRIKHA